jgi:hypothetical protein
MSYNIVLHCLGQDVKDGDLIRAPRSDWKKNDLAYNMEELWAWNISGMPGFESDGPAVFIEWL